MIRAAIDATSRRRTISVPPAVGGQAGIGVWLGGGNLGNISATNRNLYCYVSATSSDLSLLNNVAGRATLYVSAPDVSSSFNYGMPYSQAHANGWILKDSAGVEITVVGVSTNYAGDIGSVGYQNAWVTNVLGFLSPWSHVNAVFIDDVLYDPNAHYGKYPAKYPDTASYSAAMVSFMAGVYSQLNAAGVYVVPNAGAYKSGDATYNDGTSTVNWFTRLAPYTDGLLNENYVQTSATGTPMRSASSSWSNWNRVVATAQNNGCDFYGITYGADMAHAVYGAASFYMEWNGGGGAYIFKNGQTDPTNTAWTLPIGTPSALKTTPTTNTFMRLYSNGVALVNTDATASHTVSLGGSYVTSGGATVTSVTLGPVSGQLLTSP